MSEKVWTAEEEDLLMKTFADTPNRELAEQLQRSVSSITNKATRMGLVKEGPEEEDVGPPEIPIELMSREDAMKLDKIDLLRINWGILEVLKREIASPDLKPRERIRLVGCMSTITTNINSIMKGSEDQLGRTENLKAVMKTIWEKRTIGGRRIRRKDKYRGYVVRFV